MSELLTLFAGAQLSPWDGVTVIVSLLALPLGIIIGILGFILKKRIYKKISLIILIIWAVFAFVLW